MQQVIDYIEERRASYENHEFITHLLDDESIPGEKRLAWGPTVIPFIMGYSDLNKYVFRKCEDDAQIDKLQELLNAHTYEEDFHWQWMLTDLEKLDADSSMHLSDAARVLWSSDFKHSRQLCLELAALAANAPTYALFAMVDAVEAVSVTVFAHCRGITVRDGRECEFFGTKHYMAEASHSIKSPEVEEAILPHLDDAQREESRRMVDRVFSLFDDWSSSLLRFARESGEHDREYKRMVQESKDLLPEAEATAAAAF